MSKYINPEALRDGVVLFRLKQEFLKKQSRENLFPLLCCLRDSVVQVPMNVILGEEDQESLKKMKPGELWKSGEDIRMKPDILKAPDGKLWFPVFSQEKQIPESYKKNFSIVPMEMLHCIEMAHHTRDVEGLIVDAFSDAVSLPFQLADIIKELPSQLQPKEK